MKNVEASMENREPLAFLMRPKNIDDYMGQESILGKGKILRKFVETGKMVNSIFFGPPGTGKTSLAEVIANQTDSEFIKTNAANISVGEIKEIVKEAKNRLKSSDRKTILFLDEIHRFNKLQQDSLLSSTEDGTIVLIGATTENPYFSINNALLSRCIVFEFKKIDNKSMEKIIQRAAEELKIKINEDIVSYIIQLSQGDARIALNYTELIKELGGDITPHEAKEILGHSKVYFDKEQDHYDTISAFIKSIRGSDPDAAVYWLGKMLAGGENPEFIARRLVILAAEDIGLANPDALNLAVSTMHAAKTIGMPEMRIILAETVIYMAISTKSNTAYRAINDVMRDIENGVVFEVPYHIKNNGNNKYKYPHDYDNNFVYQRYLPEDKKYYAPGNNRNELLIKEKLKKLWGGKDG